MENDFVNKIVGSYGAAIDGKPWHDDAIKTLMNVIDSIDEPTKKVSPPLTNAIDYSRLRDFIDSRNIDGVLDRLKFNLDIKKIKTNSELIDYAKGREPLLYNGVRDVFCFRATGHSGIKALYTYMNKVLDYCPFENGYTPKELNR
jgi:hypothetical protein